MYVESSLPPVAVIKTPADTVLTSVYTPCLATLYTETPLTSRTYLGTGTITTCFLNTVFTVLSLGLYGKECLLCICVCVFSLQEWRTHSTERLRARANGQMSRFVWVAISAHAVILFLLSHFNMESYGLDFFFHLAIEMNVHTGPKAVVTSQNDLYSTTNLDQ